LNFSCYRKLYQRLLPDAHILDLYQQMGGRLVSIGSDSHQISHFDDFYHHAQNEIKQRDLLVLGLE
ncbi:MAG: hypothetical protein U1C33_07785, partial [Candidatus Cloacimonadaceae bacterium]|nr:hypothetical protein [Candidatus Cloacimonadaceae bacterium]